MKNYRANSMLEQFIVAIVVAVFRRRETPLVDQITTLVITDPRFGLRILNNAREADRVMRHGVERSVRNVLQNLRFTTGRYEGKRACLLVPVPGRKAGYMQFTPRLTVHELTLIRDRMNRSAQGLLDARNDLDTMITDLQAQGADRLEDIYPPGDMAVGL